MVHVTANEAGRNEVIKDRLLTAIDYLIEAIIKGDISNYEILQSLKIIKRFIINRLKTQITGGD